MSPSPRQTNPVNTALQIPYKQPQNDNQVYRDWVVLENFVNNAGVRIWAQPFVAPTTGGVALINTNAASTNTTIPAAGTLAFTVQAGSTVVTDATTSATIGLPIAFTSVVVCILVANGDVQDNPGTVGVNQTFLQFVNGRFTEFSVTTSTSGDFRVNWLAIGA